MARVCQVTGKSPMVGHQVSHANNKTKRRFMPNLQYRRFWVESENRWVRLRLTTAGLRTGDKVGIDAVLPDLSGMIAETVDVGVAVAEIDMIHFLIHEEGHVRTPGKT